MRELRCVDIACGGTGDYTRTAESDCIVCSEYFGAANKQTAARSGPVRTTTHTPPEKFDKTHSRLPFHMKM
jgi:hypothetical protein